MRRQKVAGPRTRRRIPPVSTPGDRNLIGRADDGVDRDIPRWSANGRLLYYVALPDGLANVWAVDFDPTSGRIGEPFQVTYFSGPDEALVRPEISVAHGQLAIPVRQSAGAIYSLEVR
jgi:hypothetical protein